MSLSEQVRALMVAAQVLPLERLEELLPSAPGGGVSAQQRRDEIVKVRVVYLHTWYTSTNTDAEGASVEGRVCVRSFTCFNGTEVQILT
jgi:hypothetical protein